MSLRNEILIFEDETSLAEAMKEAFQREGFTVYVTSRVAEAEDLISKKPIGTLFVDCLLPETGGVEFAASLRKKYPPGILEIILMSGILNDPGFVKDSLRETAGKHFLKKPFDLEEAVALVNKPIQTSKVSLSELNPRKNMYEIYRKGRLSPQIRKDTIEKLEDVYGYDLPFIYSLIIDSRASGDLSVMEEGQIFAKIGFAHGSIVNVFTAEKDASLGKLLLDSGFVHPEDLVIAENDKSNKKFGEKLISNFLASPHGLDLVLTQQMNIRLSKTIVDKKFKVSFQENGNEESATQIDTEMFISYLHDWIASKIPLVWLKAHLLQWSSSKMMKTDYFKPDHIALTMPLVKALPGIVDSYTYGATLQEIIDAKLFAEEPVYKSLMFLLSKGLITFEENKQTMSPDEQLKILTQLHQQFNDVNQAQVYDWMVLMVSGDPAKPEAVLMSIKKLMGPIPDQKQVKLYSLYMGLNAIVEGATEFVKSGKRDQMRENLIKGEVEKQMRVSKVMDNAKDMLMKSTFKPALDALKTIQSQAQSVGMFRIYFAWARIGSLDATQNKEAAISAIEMDLLQVPPEEKSDALFSYVSGLVAKARGDKTQAKKLFEKALSLDPSLSIAKRELSLMASSTKTQSQQDSKGLFGLFKK